MGGLPTRHRRGGVLVDVSDRSAPSYFSWPGFLWLHLSKRWRLQRWQGSDGVVIPSFGKLLGVSGGRAAALRWEL